MQRTASGVTIKDLAAQLGMSHSTVSRALNDHPTTSQATKARVREAADRMGYVANLSARMIRGDAGLLVGLIVPDIRNDFYSRIAKELTDQCRQSGLRLLLAITDDDPEIEALEIRALLEARVSGLIATLTSQPVASSLAMLRTVPTIQLVRRLPGVGGDFVGMEDKQAARIATEHLLELGHRNIGYVGTSGSISAGEDRAAGFLQAHEAIGISVSHGLIELVPPRQEFGASAVSRMLSAVDRPTALVIGSSELTIGALLAIREAGLTIPGDISVVGYGDPVWFQLLDPGLTAIGLPVEQLASAASQALFARINSSGDAQLEGPSFLRFSPDLVHRGSTTQPPAN